MDRFSTVEWSRKSWVESANEAACGFPLQSLPYCILSGAAESARPGVGIGAWILDLYTCNRLELLAGLPAPIRRACEAQTLNALVACDTAEHAALRSRLMDLLDAAADQTTRETVRSALTPTKSATLLKPIESSNFTDFYASIHHATRVGRLFRPEQPLLPNYKFVPIGYHGRASSVVVSGTAVHRPHGQTKPGAGKPDGNSPDQSKVPGFGPIRFLDYEVEIGAYITGGNSLGKPVEIGRAGECLFGLSLVNDWSARDIQSWEYQPLGPFLAKSFATSVSPWVVPLAAFAPFRVPISARPAEDPAPLDYLWNTQDQESGAIDLTLEAFLSTSSMRAEGMPPHRLSRSNLRHLYWTLAQMIAHHTSNGCNLLSGDLVATGTVSGPEEDAASCLLELSEGGTKPIPLPNGEHRTVLEDGDEVILRGFCRRDGLPEISLGECRGMVLPAF